MDSHISYEAKTLIERDLDVLRMCFAQMLTAALQTVKGSLAITSPIPRVLLKLARAEQHSSRTRSQIPSL